MPSRTPIRKQPSPRKQPTPRKRPPSGKMPLLGLMAFFLLAAVLAYLWTSRHAPVAPVAVQSAPAAPVGRRHIYSETANPTADIAAALAQAKRRHKRVLLDFGGDWCPDCQVLDIYLRQSPNAQLLATHYILVHVWIGQMDANLDVAARYGVPIARGVPALAVLAADGRVVYSQKTGEFNNMSHMGPDSVTSFLNAWKS